MKKVLLLDLDDTLIRTIHTGFLRVSYSLEKLGLLPISREQFSRVYGKIPFPECALQWVQEKEFNKFLDYYQEAKKYHSYSSIINIPRFVDQLTSRNWQIGLVTNTPVSKLTQKLNEVNTKAEIFNFICCDAGKPSSVGIEKAKTFFSYNHADEFLYVGDSIFDYIAATNGEVPFYAVLSGNTSREDFQLAGLSDSRILVDINHLSILSDVDISC